MISARSSEGEACSDVVLEFRAQRAETLRQMGLRGRAAAEYGGVARLGAITLGSDHPDTQLACEWEDRLLRRKRRPSG